MATFEELKLEERVLRAVRDAGYTKPTPIQERGIPAVLSGRDVLGCAQTGTGKTAAFTLPTLSRLLDRGAADYKGPRRPRLLILAPTRELAAQIAEAFDQYSKYARLKHVLIFGGVSEKPQIRALKSGVDAIVATPGRLLDLMGQGYVDLSRIEEFILDEADRMLDMGFIHDIRKIVEQLPSERQTLLFSATVPNSIAKLADSVLRDPVRIDIEPEQPAVERIAQSVMFVDKSDKYQLLTHLFDNLDIDRAVVFSRTKHGANRIVKKLEKDGFSSAAIHGNKSQNARTRALNGFREGDIRFLVATDIAARGIDVEEVTHVFNYDLPNEAETYVHRIGRTARAGRDGIAISFCDDSEGGYLRDIERLLGERIEKDEEQQWHRAASIPDDNMTGNGKRKGGGRRGRGRNQGGGGGGGRGGNRRRRRRGGNRGGSGQKSNN